MPTHSFLDNIIVSIDAAVRTVMKPAQRLGVRPHPGTGLPETKLTLTQKQHITGLMRVNHAGEVSAQALYQGQALTARNLNIKKHLHAAAEEEIDHLAWCEQRLSELNSHTSFFNPLWYSGSFIIGALAGLAGDNISLGFLAETERQVTQHLQRHLSVIPAEDLKTQAILKQMVIDETSHAQSATARGGVLLPAVIRTMMHWSSRVLTFSSYYL